MEFICMTESSDNKATNPQMCIHFGRILRQRIQELADKEHISYSSWVSRACYRYIVKNHNTEDKKCTF